MDITRLDREQLYQWLVDELGKLDLGGGRIRQNYAVTVEPAVPSLRDYFHVGTAEAPILTIDSIEATALDDLAEFLDQCGEVQACLDGVDDLMLQDANITDGRIVTATSVAVALTALTAAPIAMLTAPFPKFSVPHWPSSILAPSSFKTRALPENQIIFVHPCRPVSYIVQPITDIVRQGHKASLFVKTAVYRLRRDEKVPMTRLAINEQ